MNTRTWIPLAFLALACGIAHADEVQFTIPAQTVKLGVEVAVPSDAKILTVSVAGGSENTLTLLLKDGEEFDANASLVQQADYFSNNTGGPASLAIGTYATPALHEGTWHVAIANRATTSSTVTLSTSTSDTAKVPTDFEINFDAAPAALVSAFGGADKFECDVGPWSDSKELTVNGKVTTLGAFRQSLLKATLSELSTQIHSPIPVRVQACWKKFDDSGEHAGSYTLAAAQGTYLFHTDAGMPFPDQWYAMAPAERLAGHRNCQYYSDVDCSIPEIVVWYNSAEVAEHSYDGPEDEALIKSVTMHEITHGLGFLSLLGVSEKTDDGQDNPNFMKLFSGYIDAYTANAGFLFAPPTESSYRTISLLNLPADKRKAALTSGSLLVWNDPELANSADNVLSPRPAPQNLVELHAPSKIQPGSTLSHLSAVHHGQLMTAVIQSNFPQTLGLAGPMLARAGWNTSPLDLSSPYDRPISGNWYDPAHSGHGIEIARAASDPTGDKYIIVFYTFDQSGDPEYYVIPSRLKNGHMGAFDDPMQPAAMGRPIYDPIQKKETYPDGPVGSMSIDFTPAAVLSPACSGRTGSHLAVLNWTVGGSAGSWCIGPALGLTRHPSIDKDLNGFWNAGSADSGWGLTIIEDSDAGGNHINTVLLYYYDDHNQPRWVQVDPNLTSNNVQEPHGYCRTCDKEPLSGTVIGDMDLGLTRPEHVALPSGDNTVDIDIDKYGFKRTNTALRMYSIPSGQ